MALSRAATDETIDDPELAAAPVPVVVRLHDVPRGVVPACFCLSCQLILLLLTMTTTGMMF